MEQQTPNPRASLIAAMIGGDVLQMLIFSFVWPPSGMTVFFTILGAIVGGVGGLAAE